MRLLVTSDIHQTDNPRDSYRFGLWEWLAKQQITYNPDAVLILGDLTDAKDKHSSTLVNSVVEGLRLLDGPIYINKGNHDFIDVDNPYFKFLNELDNVHFICDPTYVKSINSFFLPYQSTQDAFNRAFKAVPSGALVFMHQTITGAISETGQALTGFTMPSGHKAKAVYSGDIHVPHKVDHKGTVTYVGSPYHVHFGDKFEPRVLLLGVNDYITEKNLYFEAPRKFHLRIRDISELSDLKEGDQIKIELELTPAELVEWANHKKALLDYCQQKGVEVYDTRLKKLERRKRERLDDNRRGKSKLEYFIDFCNVEKLPEQIRKAGISFIEQ